MDISGIFTREKGQEAEKMTQLPSKLYISVNRKFIPYRLYNKYLTLWNAGSRESNYDHASLLASSKFLEVPYAQEFSPEL